MPRTISEFSEQLSKAWSLDTSSKWSVERPSLGQCSVSALVLQDVFGGEVLKTRVEGSWHFYNRIDGQRFDLTAEQFETAISYDDLPASREDALLDTSHEQYRALRAALKL